MIQVSTRQVKRSAGRHGDGPVGQRPVQEDGRQEQGDLAHEQAGQNSEENPGHLSTLPD